MEKDYQLKILYLKTVPSTQIYLKNLLKEKQVQTPIAIVSEIQTDGIGSRNNTWLGLEGNLFLSFAIPLNNLPKDLKIESSSIYFAYILKETLSCLGSKVWLKWPNDFYIEEFKIGGMITGIVDDIILCGVGLNMVDSPDQFATLDINISKEVLLKKYFENIKESFSWKQVFSKYKLEFYKNKSHFTHNNNFKISLENAILCSDGSIKSNGERIYSLR